jgi:hypothetical protein
MCCAKLLVPPSLAIAKTRSIASSLSILVFDFKASWQWLSRFKACRGLQKMLLHGEGAEVNKNDPELLATLKELGLSCNMTQKMSIIWTRLTCFFDCFQRYSLLMPNEDISTTKGKKKAKDRISLIVCTNTSRMHKIPYALIRKPKELACIKDR